MENTFNYNIHYTESYLTRALQLNHKVSADRFLRWPLKLICYLGLLLLFLVFISVPLYPLALFIFVLIVLLAAGPRLDYKIALWRFRRSTECDSYFQVGILSDNFYWKSDSGQGDMKWKGFLKVYRFKDGFLLFYNKQIFYWLPDASLVDGNVAEVDAILRQNISDYRGNGSLD